ICGRSSKPSQPVLPSHPTLPKKPLRKTRPNTRRIDIRAHPTHKRQNLRGRHLPLPTTQSIPNSLDRTLDHSSLTIPKRTSLHRRPGGRGLFHPRFNRAFTGALKGIFLPLELSAGPKPAPARHLFAGGNIPHKHAEKKNPRLEPRQPPQKPVTH